MSLSVPNQGLLWCLLIFVLAAALVHGAKLIALGYRAARKKEEPRPAPEKEPEPVYYLVEKRKKRSKTEYGTPKKIEFR